MLLAFLLTALLLPPEKLASRPIDSCGRLDREGTTYELQADVSSAGTCFVVAADGITLDLNRHTVTYGTQAAAAGTSSSHVHGVLAQACWDTAGKASPDACGDKFSRLTIRNGDIIEAEGAPAYSHAIRVGQGNHERLRVEDVRLRISSPSTAGILVLSGRGGNSFRGITIENHSEKVLNRHQLEGAGIKVLGAANATGDVFENVVIRGGPQTGLVVTSSGTRVASAVVALAGTVTNDFAIMLIGDRMQAVGNRIAGRGRGVQIDGAATTVADNQISGFEEAVNQEYGGCQARGTFGVQLEARSRDAVVTRNDVEVRATACDARAFRATSLKPGNANRSHDNRYRALRNKTSTGKAIAASFAAVQDVLLENDVLEADDWNVEIDWDGARNVVIRNGTFIKGAGATEDYATFTLLPGSNDPASASSAELQVIDPTFRNGASPDSYYMRPIGFGKWATRAEYSIAWSYLLRVLNPDGTPVGNAAVEIRDNHDKVAFRGITQANGEAPRVDLKQFRRFNTATDIQREDFSYRVLVSAGERKRESVVSPAAPRVEVMTLP